MVDRITNYFKNFSFSDTFLSIDLFFKTNPAIAMFLYVLGFTNSGRTTYFALAANSPHRSIWLACTILIEVGEAICWRYAIITKGFRKVSFYTVWSLLCFFSIAAAMTFYIAENNIEENKTMQTSPAFLKMKQDEETYKKQYNDAKAEKERLETKLTEAEGIYKTDKATVDNKKTKLETDIETLKGQLKQKGKDKQEAANKGNWGKYTTLTNDEEQIKKDIKDKQTKLSSLSVTDGTAELKQKIAAEKIKMDTADSNLTTKINYTSLPKEKATAGFLVLYQYLDLDSSSFGFYFHLALAAVLKVFACMIYGASISGSSPTPSNPDPTKKKKPEIDIPELENKPPTLSDKKGNLGTVVGQNLGQDNEKIQDNLSENSRSWDALESAVPRSGKNNKNVLEKRPKLSQNVQDKKEKMYQKSQEKVSEIDLRKCLNFGTKYAEEHGKFPSRAEIMKSLDWKERRARNVIEELQSRNIIGTGKDGIVKKTVLKRNKRDNAM